MASGAAQRAIGVGQILGGLLYAAYGGSYGGSGGGSYLIGSGIANASGSKYGSARRGTKGFYQDLYGSLGAAGSSIGIGGLGRKKKPEEEDYGSPYLKDLLTNQYPNSPLVPDSSEQWTPEYFGYPTTPYPMITRQNDISAAAPQQSSVFGGLRKLLLGEYA